MSSSPPETWPDARWRSLIEGYAYPAACLLKNRSHPELVAGDVLLSQYRPNDLEITGQAFEEFHKGLLLSPDENDRVHGVLSVVFWGNYAGADGRTNGFALSRAVRVARDLIGQTACLGLARTAVLSNDLRSAFLAYRSIKWVGSSFASKLVAFACPSRAAVLDSVICGAISKIPELAEVGARFTKHHLNSDQAATYYETWCVYCQKFADRLNYRNIFWHDRNGQNRSWRSLDVERAIFAKLGSN